MYLKKPINCRHITVKLPQKNQDIIIGDNLFGWLMKEITARNYSKTIILVDQNVFHIHAVKLRKFIKKIGPVAIVHVESKESSKSLWFLNYILEGCCKKALNRKSCLIAIGGGIVGDISGFIASVYMRGIDYIFVPTTLMAQGDTIISKVAISYKLLKNIIGSFFSPVLTVCDVSFLNSLPKKEISIGLSEIIKHACTNGGNLLKLLDQTLQNGLKDWKKYPWQDIIYQSLLIKSKIVEKDPYDQKGIHKSLSYGHTFANALEGLSSFKYRHGEAVALGMQLSGLVSNRLDLMTQKDLLKQNMLIKRVALTQHIISSVEKEEIIAFLRRDKISDNNEITLVLLRRLGNPIVLKNIDENIVGKIINDFYLKNGGSLTPINLFQQKGNIA